VGRLLWHGQISKIYQIKTEMSILYPILKQFQFYTAAATPQPPTPLWPEPLPATPSSGQCELLTGTAFGIDSLKPRIGRISENHDV
jgi:hypothetical protein